MKVSPVQGGGTNIGSVNMQSGTGADRLASAKAVAMGESPMRIIESDTPIDPRVTTAQQNIRTIKMNVNQSTNRPIVPAEEAPQQQEATQSANPDVNEKVVQEETKPLSPQLAALAKQRRSLQLDRAAFDKEKAQFASTSKEGSDAFVAKLKSEPLRVLQEQGILNPDFYNSMTEFLVSGQGGINPEVQSLKAEIKSLKEGIDKNFVDRDQAAKQQVLAQMSRDAESLARDGETFELIRETRSVPTVIRLIDRTFEKTGEVLDVADAMKLVEQELFNDHLKIASTGKIKSKILPAEQPQQRLQPQQQRQITTLTNRDTARPQLGRRERAILAAQGLLKG